FFALGGHSLLAVQLIARLRQRVGVEVAVAEVFRRPELAALAAAVRQASRAALPPITPVERTGSLALSFAQERLWFLDQLGGVEAVYHIPWGVRLRGQLEREALRRALAGVVARHEAVRTTFVTVEGVPRQEIAPAETSRVPLVEHDLRTHPEPEAELERLVAREAQAPFDLARGPLLRGRLIRLANQEHVLLLTMHHIVADGWSMGVLVNELSALYGAFVREQADPLPPLPVQYVDYAAWQRRWLAGEVLQQQAAYWQQTLRGAP